MSSSWTITTTFVGANLTKFLSKQPSPRGSDLHLKLDSWPESFDILRRSWSLWVRCHARPRVCRTVQYSTLVVDRGMWICRGVPFSMLGQPKSKGIQDSRSGLRRGRQMTLHRSNIQMVRYVHVRVLKTIWWSQKCCSPHAFRSPEVVLLGLVPFKNGVSRGTYFWSCTVFLTDKVNHILVWRFGSH